LKTSFAKVRVYACLSRLSCGEMSKGDTQQVPPFELSPLRVDMDLLTKWFSKKTVLKKVQEKAVSAIKSTKTGQDNQSLFSK